MEVPRLGVGSELQLPAYTTATWDSSRFCDLHPSPAQWVKDLALLQLGGRLQPQLGFDLWPRNFHMLWVWPKKGKKQKQKQKTNSKV